MNFNEFYHLLEGMGSYDTVCMRCNQKQKTSTYTWNSGKAKCKSCGGGLNVVEKDDKKEEKPIQKENINTERRFRASIYVDLFVPKTDDLEQDRMVASKQLEEYTHKIPNSYVGNIAAYNPHNLLNPLDKEL